ncbi:MAG: hypothetical protein EU542_04065 [Promethearchaeota archaeon]|nr:MAG: hypothetical protein EU542_04065 [Candidatus Lokiarchaeota archaeon]
MRKNSVIGLSLLTFLLVLILPIFALAIPQTANSSLPFEVPKPSISWDLESYYNYTGPKIHVSDISAFAYPRVYINGADPIYNWSYWSAYPWLTGSGTEGDPYIIEKLFINATNDGACIFIRHSSKNFIIRQCYFTHTGLNEFDSGLYFQYVENGEVYGNIINYAHNGFHLHHGCINIKIYQNFMKATKIEVGRIRAFWAEGDPTNCSFNQNLIYNYEQLAKLSGTSNMTINGNFMNNTEYEEYPNNVIIFHSATRVKFRENIFTDNYKWFDFDVSQVDCANNTITGNGVINDLSSVSIPTPLSIGPFSRLHTAQSSGGIMALSSTTNSQVVNNYIYQPGGAIPGFEPFLLLVVIAVMGIIFTIVMIQKNHKLNYLN